MNSTEIIFNDNCCNETNLTYVPFNAEAEQNIQFLYRYELADFLTINSFHAISSENETPPFLNSEAFKISRFFIAIIAFILNILFLILNLVNGRKRKSILKVRLLLLFLSLVLAISSLAYTSIFGLSWLLEFLNKDYETENKDVYNGFSLLGYDDLIVWRNTIFFVIEPLFDLQSILFMCIAIDRYASFFLGYRAYIESRWNLLNFLFIPLIFSFILISSGIQYYILPYHSLLYFRLCVTILPTIISLLVLCVCLAVKRYEHPHHPGYSISLSKQLVRVLFVSVLLQMFCSFIIIWRLFETNVNFSVKTGSAEGDAIFETISNFGLQIAICVSYFFPIFLPVALTIFVKHFRDLVFPCSRSNKVNSF